MGSMASSDIFMWAEASQMMRASEKRLTLGCSGMNPAMPRAHPVLDTFSFVDLTSMKSFEGTWIPRLIMVVFWKYRFSRWKSWNQS